MKKTREIWRDIDNYKSIYQVSNHGRIRSLDRTTRANRKIKGRVLTPSPDHGGYLMVSLCRDQKKETTRVHRLVGEHFVVNPKGKPAINHIDEDKTNNHQDNLEWVTYKENTNHGTLIDRLSHINSKNLPLFYVYKKGSLEFVGSWNNQHKCGLDLNISNTQISSCLLMKPGYYSAKGYIFTYKEILYGHKERK